MYQITVPGIKNAVVTLDNTIPLKDFDFVNDASMIVHTLKTTLPVQTFNQMYLLLHEMFTHKGILEAVRGINNTGSTSVTLNTPEGNVRVMPIEEFTTIEHNIEDDFDDEEYPEESEE